MFWYSAFDRSRRNLQIGSIDIADIFNARKLLTKYFKNRQESPWRTVPTWLTMYVQDIMLSEK